MPRPSRQGLSQARERMRQDFTHTAQLRDLYPHLAELRVEFQFKDETARAPSPQLFSYFSAARAFFRYACPSHACSGQFDLSQQIGQAAAGRSAATRTKHVNLQCAGERAGLEDARSPCPICAIVSIDAIPRAGEAQ